MLKVTNLRCLLSYLDDSLKHSVQVISKCQRMVEEEEEDWEGKMVWLELMEESGMEEEIVSASSPRVPEPCSSNP